MISGKAGSGKDTCSEYIQQFLEEHNKTFFVIHFADMVKMIAKQVFKWDGNKDENGRTLLQQIGDNDFRNIDKDYWAKRVKEIIYIYKDTFDYAIIPDLRYKNELKLISDIFKSYSIRINRNFKSKLTELQLLNPSECDLDKEELDYTLTDVDLYNTQLKIYEIMEEILNG